MATLYVKSGHPKTGTMEFKNSVETFRSRFDSWIYRLADYARLASDTDEQRLRKAVLILLAVIYTALGIVWSIAYFALGRPLAGSFPLGYSVISTLSLIYFFRAKTYKFFCRGQLALILILPVLLQWSLGGFAASGAVVIWSILAPIGALMFAGTARAIPWFVAYLLLMLISGILSTEPDPQPLLPTVVIIISFVLNIGGVSAIAFFLLKYFVQAREQAMAALEREHRRVRQSLSLAMEVQQNLLPRDTPRVAGLDIAGTSIYCDETGGDYYDYLTTGEAAEEKLGVVVGDVSEHGIPSALLMATVRAQIRQRYYQAGGLDRVICDVNRQLAQDVQDSGRFMTLFMADVDRKSSRIFWLNAGHEPAIIYTPEANTIDELAGSGSLPLGITDNFEYTVNHRDITAGQILAIATDGIFETQNPKGEMFGRQRFYDIIRQNAAEPSGRIMNAILEAVNDFRKDLPPKDDLTLMIIKIKPDN